jgi:predicted transcriptional regulator
MSYQESKNEISFWMGVILVVVALVGFFFFLRGQTVANGDAIEANGVAIKELEEVAGNQTEVLRKIGQTLTTRREIDEERRDHDKEKQGELKQVIKDLHKSVENLADVLRKIKKE